VQNPDDHTLLKGLYIHEFDPLVAKITASHVQTTIPSKDVRRAPPPLAVSSGAPAGDLDSIRPEVLAHYEGLGTIVASSPDQNQGRGDWMIIASQIPRRLTVFC